MNTQLTLAITFLSSFSAFAATPAGIHKDKPGRPTAEMPRLLERAQALPSQMSLAIPAPAPKKTSRRPRLKGAAGGADPDSQNEESCLETL